MCNGAACAVMKSTLSTTRMASTMRIMPRIALHTHDFTGRETPKCLCNLGRINYFYAILQSGWHQQHAALPKSHAALHHHSDGKTWPWERMTVEQCMLAIQCSANLRTSSLKSSRSGSSNFSCISSGNPPTL